MQIAVFQIAVPRAASLQFSSQIALGNIFFATVFGKKFNLTWSRSVTLRNERIQKIIIF
jgi:hypothetical protein